MEKYEENTKLLFNPGDYNRLEFIKLLMEFAIFESNFMKYNMTHKVM